MTAALTPDVAVSPPTAAGSAPPWLRGAGRFALAYCIALVAFALIVVVKGANPATAILDMVRSTLHARSLGQVLNRTAPYLLGALAVAVPARAGLVNVGGEGQIVIGCVGAAAAARWLGGLPGPGVIVAMVLAGALAGAVWASIAAVLRIALRIPEAITTLLLNYVAIDVMLYLIYEPWKDPTGTGQPTSKALAPDERLPTFSVGGTHVHIGILLALAAALIVWIAMRTTVWGFTLRAVGGNTEAARRAGLPVRSLMLSAMLIGGALAGVAGMTHYAGAEFKLRTGMTAGFGYTAFLASWLGRHRPIGVIAGSLLLAFLAIGGTSLQLDASLPAATVNVLIGLVLLATLAIAARRSGQR